MSKEPDHSESTEALPTSAANDSLTSSLPARTGPYRSLSAKRPRDPSHRKSVSFNDVPIVHEVPLHDSMRNSNCTAFRSWTYTDATPATPIIPTFHSSQILSSFNSPSTSPQKLHANRLSSTLYSSLNNNSTPSRIPDWAMRAKTARNPVHIEETTTSNEQSNSIWSPPTILVHTPEEKINKEVSGKTSLFSTYSNPYLTHTQTAPTQATNPTLSNTNASENDEEKKIPYRAAVVTETNQYRSLPFTYEHVTDSTATYTSMLSTHLIPPAQPTNEPTTTTTTNYMRAARARSATLPSSVNNPSSRTTDTISITPFRPPTSSLSVNGTAATSRAVLRPTTIAFQYTQPQATSLTSSANNNTVTNVTNMINATTGFTNNNLTTTMINPSMTITSSSSSKPPPVPTRYGSAMNSTATGHSRFLGSPTRAFPNSSLLTSNMKYPFAHQNLDSSLIHATTPSSNGSPTKPPPTAYPRSRSATVLSTRRNASSSATANENHTTGHATTGGTVPGTNLYGTTKRNPNVRQNYGSYYMHRVLLPTSIN